MAQRWSADRNCFSPIRRHYHAPSCSNGSVKCQTGNSVLLCPALRSAPTVAKTPPPPSVLPLPLRASPFPQRCDCAAKLWLLFLLVSVPSLHRLRSPSFFRREAGRQRALFFEGVIVYGECAEEGASVGAKRKKETEERKKERKSEQISVISVGNLMYVAAKRNDTTFAK